MIAVPWKAEAVLALVMIGAGSAWQFQDWRYGKPLAEQSRQHADTLNHLTQRMLKELSPSPIPATGD